MVRPCHNKSQVMVSNWMAFTVKMVKFRQMLNICCSLVMKSHIQATIS